MKSFLVRILSKMPWMLKACELFVRPVKVCICRFNYARVLRRIRGKKGRIRVLFKVSEIAKWKCQTVFEQMKGSVDFDPLIVLVPDLPKYDNSSAALESKFQEQEQYFDRLGYAHVRGMFAVGRRYSDFREFKPDIVFLPDPWTTLTCQSPYSLSRVSLVCYVPYYVNVAIRTAIQCQLPFHRYLYAFFEVNQETVERYRASIPSAVRAPKYIATGHPALDNLHLSHNDNPNGWIIYAPHWSVLHPLPDSRIATFMWSGRVMLEYARSHPECRWLFKPHPSLRKQLIETGVMSREDVEAYYQAWEKIATLCYDSNYQKIFQESRLMITDSASFLAEYPVTGHPLIRLCNRDIHGKPCYPRLWNSYYIAYDSEDMLRIFKEVIEDGKDPKREERIAAVKEAGLGGVNAARNIVDYLRNTCRG